MPHRSLAESSTDKFGPSSSIRMLSRQNGGMHRRTTSDKHLLYVFLTAVFLVTASLFAVQLPQDLDHPTINGNHDAGVHQLKSTSRRRPVVVQYTDDKLPVQEGSANKRNEETTEDVESNMKSQQHRHVKPQQSSQRVGEERNPPNQQESKAAIVPSKNEGKRNRNASYHVVFSTGCSTFQEGQVTRIASGCNDEATKDIQTIFDQQIKVMAPDRFHLHLTPDFSKIKQGYNFKYFNKPYGMQHWMREALGYPDNHQEHDDTIVILMDPDQIMLRPFTDDFSNSSEVWRLKEPYRTLVDHGSPFAQQYGFGLQWKEKINIEHVANGKPSPVATMDRKEAFDYYMAMGPPYVATLKDMYSIVVSWADSVVRIHDDYPHLLAEMFGYNFAAAHLGLRHTIAFSFMVSDATAGGEGWKLIDPVSDDDLCYNFPASQYPHVLHYCQRYMIGKWFIGKYRLRKDFISCESPLLSLPPADIASKYDFAIAPDGTRKEYGNNSKLRKYHTFMVCTLIQALNDAATYFKDHHCDKETANYDKSYVFHDDMNLEEDTL